MKKPLMTRTAKYLFKNVLIITFLSLVFHFIMTAMGLFLYNSPLVSTSESIYIDLFSKKMYPFIFSYGLLFFIIITLIQRVNYLSNKVSFLKKQEENYEEELGRLQKVSALFMDNIASQNGIIKEWVFKKKNCGKAPEVVEGASDKIGRTLEMFSRSFFVQPYSGDKRLIPHPVIDEDERHRISHHS